MLVAEKTFADAVRSFLISPKFSGYSDATRDVWARYLNFAAHIDCLGAISIDEIRPSIVQGYMDGLAGRPGAQAASIRALTQFENWAIVRDILPRPITTGVEIGTSNGGHTPWTDEHVAIGERYARPDLARVITLGANTGQRGSDLIRMGPTDIEVFDGMRGIKVIQKKTGRDVWIPITSALAAAMETWERRPGPFLRKRRGGVWTRKNLTGAWILERERNPDLAPLKAAGLVLHGLRGHACVRLVRAGANTRQIADMVGMSEPMVKNYTKLSDQRANATAAVHLLERTDQERPSDMFRKNRS